MKKIIFLFLFFLPTNLFAFEAFCWFEEVYKDSSTQQGFLLIKNDKIRYEYLDENLYTIIIKNNKYFLIPNNQKDSFSIIEENTELIDELAKVFLKFPYIDDLYNRGEYTFSIEKSSDNFIKRVAIKSKDLNMSINFFDCKFKVIHDKYFMHFPLRPYML